MESTQYIDEDVIKKGRVLRPCLDLASQSVVILPDANPYVGLVEDARSTRCTHIHHGAGFIDATADSGHNLIDDLSQVIVVLKTDIRGFQLAVSLDVDLLVRVYKNI